MTDMKQLTTHIEPKAWGDFKHLADQRGLSLSRYLQITVREKLRREKAREQANA